MHAFDGFDWNGGIRGECRFCGERGFVYRNESLESNMTMCDACRDDLERRERYFNTQSQPHTTDRSPTAQD